MSQSSTVQAAATVASSAKPAAKSTRKVAAPKTGAKSPARKVATVGPVGTSFADMAAKAAAPPPPPVLVSGCTGRPLIDCD